jgi:hypothetical protein
LIETASRKKSSPPKAKVPELGIGDHPIDNPEREGLCGIERFGGEIQLACLAGADKLGQKITAAEVPGKSGITRVCWL